MDLVSMEIKAKYRNFRHISAVLGTLVGAPMVLDVRKIVRYTYPILRQDKREQKMLNTPIS